MHQVTKPAALSNATALHQLSNQLTAWREDIWRYDYFAVMRRLEACDANAPRWGKAALPKAERVRIAQEPSLSFAPATFSVIEDANDKHPAILRQRFFGYIGPNGPLPVHLSDFIRERVMHHNDRTWLAFLDGFQHRFALHFYRAWAQAQPAVAMDRPDDDSFRRYIGSFIGIGAVQRQKRDEIQDDARLHFSGWLSRQVKCKDGVQSILGAYFHVPVRLEQWVGHWMPLAQTDVARLGQPSASLRQGLVVGTRVWDRQHRVRLHLGPLGLKDYESFLPGASAHRVLGNWMDQLLGTEYQWDAQLCLRNCEVLQAKLGKGSGRNSRLGWTSWLGGRPRQHHAHDVLICG
jgi:type VI secretion system protein ImpH